MSSHVAASSRRGRPFTLVISSVVFTAALLVGTWAFTFFIARSPSSNANPSTVVYYYHHHWFRGWGTVACYAVAVIALTEFMRAVGRALRRLRDVRAALRKSVHEVFYAAYVVLALVLFLIALGFRVVAPALALFYGHSNQVSLVHTMNHWVQYGYLSVAIAFLLFAIATGLALLFLGNFELKILGGLALLTCWAGFTTGAGIAIWVLVVGLWLAFHEFGNRPAKAQPARTNAEV